MDASIIIPTHNGRKWLEISLPSLHSQDYPGEYEIILVDNASSDGTASYVEENFPKVKVLKMQTNLGYADGCNSGIEHASGLYIIILNNDVEMEKHWLSVLISAANTHREYQILASVDQFPIKRDFNVYLEIRHIADGNSEKEVADSLFASGACFLIRREWLQRISKLFESYIYYEDAELSLRSVLSGANIGYVTKSRFQHFSELERSVRTPEANRMKHLNSARHSPRTKIKTTFTLFTLGSFLKLMIIHTYYLGILCLSRPDRSRENLEMIRGSLEGLMELGACVQKRREFKRLRKRPDRYVFERLICAPGSSVQRFTLRFLLG